MVYIWFIYGLYMVYIWFIKKIELYKIYIRIKLLKNFKIFLEKNN